LKAKSTQYLRASSEKESLLQKINKAKTELNELFSEIKAEDSLMMTLAAEMKELQARMDDCKARMAAKERNASQGVERTKSLVERYQQLKVDEEVVTDINTASQRQDEDWAKLREQMRSVWGEL
jgi:chromosome segregation ATPase